MRTSQAAAVDRFGWQLITPAYVLVLVLLVLPLLFSLYISFHRWDLTVVPSVLHWVGLQNFTSILNSTETWKSLSFTGLYTVLSVAGELVVGLGLALLLHRATVGRGLERLRCMARRLNKLVRANPLPDAPPAGGRPQRPLMHASGHRDARVPAPRRRPAQADAPRSSASSSAAVTPCIAKTRSTVSPILLLGVLAPAVMPTRTGPSGSQSARSVSCAYAPIGR